MADVDLDASVDGSVLGSGVLRLDLALGSSLGGTVGFSGAITDEDDLVSSILGSCYFWVVAPEVIKYRAPTRNPLPQPATVRIVPQSPSEPQTSISTVRRRNPIVEG
jgi:hypothetical protein